DLVEGPERAEDRAPDLVGVDLGGTGGAHRLLDLLGEEGEVVVGDRAALAGLAHPGHDLLAAERLDDAGPLDHREAGGLDRRAAAAAGGALAPPAHRGAVVRRPAVDGPGGRVSAGRAVHARRLVARAGHRAAPPRG